MIQSYIMMRSLSSPNDFSPVKVENPSSIRAALYSGLVEGTCIAYAELTVSVTVSSPILRICPGKDLGDASLYVVFSTVLAAFSISKARDNAGKVVEPVVEYLPGVVRYGFLVILLTFLLQ